MTTTQIAYWGLQETARHNVETEYETMRHNVRTEDETKRHNIKTENLTASQLAEQKRHNLASEELTASDIAETNRHNVKTEKETHRHNVVGEKETKRHNVATEHLTKEQQRENKRHNVATENIDWANLNERERHDRMEEILGEYSNLTNRLSQQSQKQLNDASIKLKNLDAEWYTVGLLLKGGKTGQKAAVAEVLGIQTVDAIADIIKAYMPWAEEQGEHGNASFSNYLKSNYSPKKYEWLYEWLHKIENVDFRNLVGDVG